MAHAPKSFQVASQTLFRQLADEAVVLNLDTGQYYGLDAVGVDIWRWLEAGYTRADIVTALTQTYAVDQPTAQRDVDALLAQLVTAGLVLADA